MFSSWLEEQEYLEGAVRFNPLFLSINVILIVHFFTSWYYSAKKTGWTLDYWYFTLFLSYFATFLLMYPFASSVLNVVSLGGNIRYISRSINEAYLVTLTGFMGIFAGSQIFKTYGYQSSINLVFIKPVRNTIGALFKAVATDKLISRGLFFGYLLLLFYILLTAARGGMWNNPRAYFFKDENLRVIYNFITKVSTILSAVLIGRVFQFNKNADKISFIVFVVFTFFIGARGAVIAPILQVMTYYIYFRRKGNIKVKTALIAIGGLLVLITVLTYLRAGKSTGGVVSGALTQIFYGNAFSDLRDFSWVLSLWNREYLQGKTYLAGLISFIPSAYSDFRTQWTLGRVTAVMGGFNPKEHPGIRPGPFGEAYINFGIVGVVFLGILLGYMYRYIDTKIKFYANTNDKLEAVVATISVTLVSVLGNTSGFFGIYVMAVLLFSLYMLKVLFQDPDRT